MAINPEENVSASEQWMNTKCCLWNKTPTMEEKYTDILKFSFHFYKYYLLIRSQGKNTDTCTETNEKYSQTIIGELEMTLLFLSF